MIFDLIFDAIIDDFDAKLRKFIGFCKKNHQTLA